MILTLGILTYNSDYTLRSCLESVLAQVHKEHTFEVLVVDNGSVDSTLKILTEDQWKTLNIRIFRSPENNLALARNKILEECRTEFLAFIDSDAILPTQWIEKALVHLRLESQSIVGVSGPSLFYSLQKANLFSTSLNVMVGTFFGNFNSPQLLQSTKRSHTDHLPCTAVMWRASILRAAGGFDESFSYVGEDLELGFRLRSRGFQLLLTPDLAHFHVLKSHSISNWSQRAFRFGQAQMLVAARHAELYSSYRIILPHAYLFLFFIVIVVLLIHPFFGFLLILIYFQILFLSNLKKSGDLRLVLMASLLSILTHLSYATGEASMWFGNNKRFLSKRNKKK